MDRGVGEGWELVVVARDTVEGLCNVSCSLQDDFLKKQRSSPVRVPQPDGYFQQYRFSDASSRPGAVLRLSGAHCVHVYTSADKSVKLISSLCHITSGETEALKVKEFI